MPDGHELVDPVSLGLHAGRTSETGRSAGQRSNEQDPRCKWFVLLTHPYPYLGLLQDILDLRQKCWILFSHVSAHLASLSKC